MTTELAGEPDFRGPATLEVAGRAFEVDVDLRGRSQPIDGIFRWYGRVRPHAELRDLLGESGNKTGFLSTETGSAAVTVGDIDFWGRYRVQGRSAPPYSLETDLHIHHQEEFVTDPAPADAALNRALAMIEPASLREQVTTDGGYVETLRDVRAPNPTMASRAMNNRGVAAIYEKIWRPFGVSMMGIGGLSMSAERAKAVTDLQLRGSQRVLDVASGPGNFTKFLSEHLTGDGLAVGFDISEAMIARAVRDNRGARAAYVRGDASHLPYAGGAFDAVCCYAALYLVPEPFRVVDELIRVLRPGGRIAIMTSCELGSAPMRTVVGVGSGRMGVRMFPKNQFTDIFDRAGMTDIEQEIRGLAQFVSATKQ
ncbi:Methyltransferase [Rhodococcus sp. AW25M09]|uniref:DUF4873 domain-containing protein n=1 Tax=Rhodococcus sp. AW25M09 TaxID=1268303 RepID=UPI0002AC9987|nr:DUF4873 domain-containing protein [Rhodococcus sp. AW25M09]CCQ15049.1 Methyltransferase [Rhodococcus sp. AW25M09]